MHLVRISGETRAAPVSVVGHLRNMRYLVRARVKAGCQGALLEAIESGTLGEGSVAEGEYLRNMNEARVCADETVRWVEVCYCPTPLQEERPYWEEYFDLVNVQDAHDRRKCRDEKFGCVQCGGRAPAAGDSELSRAAGAAGGGDRRFAGDGAAVGFKASAGVAGGGARQRAARRAAHALSDQRGGHPAASRVDGNI